MKIHVIIDFMHIYYKYYFQLKAGRMKRLSAGINWNGTVIEKDTTLIYYPLRDIEGIRKGLEELSHEVTMSICFDSPSLRKELDTSSSKEYKSGRKGLQEEDFKNIEFIQKLLDEAGHNTYKKEGYEADDIINNLAHTYSDKFDYTVIYTNDKDLFVNISDKVGVMRFKQQQGYTQVDKNNYSEYLEEEYGVYVPYNAIGLFLSTVGDSADKIKGISKFGPKAFSKLLKNVEEKHKIDWESCGDYSKAEEILKIFGEFLTPEQYKQAIDAFVLVSNIEIIDELQEPVNQSNQELREKAYLPYKMSSLCM